jgi:ribonucleoside-triphosphate reductase
MRKGGGFICGGATLGDDYSEKLTNPIVDEVREGVFDAQLSFETPYTEAPALISTITKRDGRKVTYEKSKIADAIFNAARSIGGEDRDRANSLASGVTIYLSKHLDGATPNVDHVHDAVEKVLIEMGHAKTALAYARYRDKRARIRKLRGGDVRAILRELEEAHQISEDAEQSGARPLFIRTSDERFDGWDRERIVTALTRETGMAEGLARIIALEVEGQVARANVETLTASLVRELVDAKLIEHGLEVYRRKHMRLGVPLFDAERIICAPNQGETEGVYDPSRTDIALAERVKKEYALSQVYSQDTADAHLRGDLHILDLGRVDRFHSAHHSLECVKRYGLPFGAGEHYVTLPLNAETLVSHVAQFNASLHQHFTRRTTWDAFNLLLAPFLATTDSRQIRQLAHMLVFGLAHGAKGLSCLCSAPTELSLVWTVPPALANVEALGPGGLPTGRPYGDFLPDARRFAWELLEVFKETRSHQCRDQDWAPLIHVSADFFAASGHEEFLAYALADPSLRTRLRFAFDRNHSLPDVPDRWQCSKVTVQEIAINLPRAAYRAANEGELMAEIEQTVKLAVKAHGEKRRFMERLMAFRDVGALGMLTFTRDGKPYLDMEDAVYRIGIAGLNDCVHTMLACDLHSSEQAIETGLRILQHVRTCAETAAATDHLNVQIAATETAEVTRRFATLDLHQFPEKARHVMKTDELTQDVCYTPGTRPAPDRNMTPLDRARIEGIFHALLDAGAETRVTLSDADFGPESMAQFVEKVFHRTRVRRLGFAPACVGSN